MAKRKYTIEDCQKLAKSKNGECLSKKYKNANTKLRWKCECKYIWRSTFSEVKNSKHWCPECGKKYTIYTIKDCQNYAKKFGGKCLSKKYKNNYTKMWWKCKHKHVFRGAFRNILTGSWCSECAGNKKLTLKQFKKIAKSKGGKCLSDKYINAHTKLEFICKRKHHWWAKPCNIKSGRWCSKCNYIDRDRNLKYSLDDCIKTAKSRGGKCLSTKYHNGKTIMSWECEKGHSFEKSYTAVLKSWCHECAGNMKLTIEHCHQVAKERGWKCLSKKYKNAQQKIKWQCNNGHIWKTTVGDVKRSNGCPVCGGVGKTQKQIYNILKELFPNYIIYYNFRRFDWLKTRGSGKLQIDIYIPHLKLAIEYQGEQHYHAVDVFGGEKEFKKIKFRDKLKKQRIRQNKKDIKTFIIFNYYEKHKISKDYIIKRLHKRGIFNANKYSLLRK